MAIVTYARGITLLIELTGRSACSLPVSKYPGRHIRPPVALFRPAEHSTTAPVDPFRFYARHKDTRQLGPLHCLHH
jgi:hypothetical protein